MIQHLEKNIFLVCVGRKIGMYEYSMGSRRIMKSKRNNYVQFALILVNKKKICIQFVVSVRLKF